MKYEKNRLMEYVHTLQSQGRYSFDRKQAMQELQLSAAAFRLSAGRLAKKMMIKRIRGDFFIIIPIEYSQSGSLPASWFIDALMKAVGAEYYVGALSAAAIYGAAHQQPMAFQIVANQIIPKITIGNVTIKFYYRQVVLPTFYMKVKTETGQMNVSTVAVTVGDCLRYPKAAGHIHNIATVLLELQGQLNMDQLMQYITGGHLEVANVQRLGYLIELLKLPLDTKPLFQWAQQQNMQRCCLISALPKTKQLNEKWKIIVNETVEPDEI